jgi:hypothetical protein
LNASASNKLRDLRVSLFPPCTAIHDRILNYAWRSTCHSVSANCLIRIILVKVLEQHDAIFFVNFFRIGAREAGIQNILNGQFNLGTGSQFLPPIEDNQFLEFG